MKDYNTVLDWKSHKIYLSPLSKQPAITQYIQSFGIKFEYRESKTVIGFVWDNTDAQKDGISLSDEVIAVNGYKDLDNHDNFCSLQKDIFSNEEIQQINITLKDKAQNIKTYTLDKMNLLN